MFSFWEGMFLFLAGILLGAFFSWAITDNRWEKRILDSGHVIEFVNENHNATWEWGHETDIHP